MKFNAKLPEGGNNGLSAIEQELVAQARDGHEPAHYVAIVILEPGDAVLKTDGDIVPSVTMRAIEVVREDIPALTRIMQRAKEKRTGDTVLPFDLEAEVAGVFAGVDPETGEVLGDGSDG